MIAHLQTKADVTYERYNGTAVKFIRQVVAESKRDDLADLDFADLAVVAARVYLESNGRWSGSYTRELALALSQWLENLSAAELVPAAEAAVLLRALKHERPKPRGKNRTRGEKRRRKRPPAKSVSVADLRRLINYFRAAGGAFSLWIAGLLQIDSRIGWRAGEVVDLKLSGNLLWARAEKRTNERGLCETCEIDLRRYPRRLIEKLEAWISETERLAAEKGGRWKLRDAARSQIWEACTDLGIRRICISTLRHHAIATMKRSGYTRKQIAVMVNHASTRTATEKYGKARTGSRRAKKRFGIDPARIELVRDTARKHGQKKTPAPR